MDIILPNSLDLYEMKGLKTDKGGFEVCLTIFKCSKNYGFIISVIVNWLSAMHQGFHYITKPIEDGTVSALRQLVSGKKKSISKVDELGQLYPRRAGEGS